MNRRLRRSVLRAFGTAGLGVLTGCLSRDWSGGPTPSSGTPSSPSNQSPEELLPREGGGWTRVRSERGSFAWSARGASDGVFGHYTSPENRAYEVVVMATESEYSPDRKARNWRCTVGWSVAISYGRFALAASTGTAQRTFTPEQPPRMTRTPVPETTDSARELLSRSPELSREYVDRHAITNADC